MDITSIAMDILIDIIEKLLYNYLCFTTWKFIMFKQNPLTNCDSYKLSHMAQYPEGTEFVYSNFTARSMAHLNVPYEYKSKLKFVFFGIQSVVMDLMNIWKEGFFDVDIDAVLSEFGRRVAPFVGPSGFDMDKITELWEYGRLPIEVRALPEGSRVNIGVPCVLIINTDPRFYWITNYLETWISCELWKMCTSATIADCMKSILLNAAEETGASKEFVLWQGHDFSMRGMSGIVDAAKSGAGHLLSFMGTDCLPAIDFIEQYYPSHGLFLGGSVPATEHSVMAASGEDDELETFRRLIQDVYPAGVVSIVSDTWDFWKVITEYSLALKDLILAREADSNGLAKVVFRPDSGDPVKILCGYKCTTYAQVRHNARQTYEEGYDAVKYDDGTYSKLEPLHHENGDFRKFATPPLTENEVKGAVEILWDIFGGDINEKGFKTLNPKVGLIYGDSITPERATEIMWLLQEKGFASSNVVLGVGSYTYQYNTRDSLGFAMKATYAVVNGVGRAIFKDPKTDNGTKKSARGLIKVVKDGDDFKLLDNQPGDITSDSGELKTIFVDGNFTYLDDFKTIRQRLL